MAEFWLWNTTWHEKELEALLRHMQDMHKIYRKLLGLKFYLYTMLASWQLNLQIFISPDMYSRGYIAYTDNYATLTSCLYKTKAGICEQSRYSADKKLIVQFLYLGFISFLRAMFGNKSAAILLKNRDSLLQKTLKLLKAASAIATGNRTFSDFADSDIHIHYHETMRLFTDSRDVAFFLFTDKAQLTMKKQSNIWFIIIINLNLLAYLRYQLENIIIPLFIPNSQSPGDLESFLYPLYWDFAKFSERIWFWGADQEKYFLLKAYICIILEDMLGSAKLSRNTGHTDYSGDRFSKVKGAKCTTGKKA